MASGPTRRWIASSHRALTIPSGRAIRIFQTYQPKTAESKIYPLRKVFTLILERFRDAGSEPMSVHVWLRAETKPREERTPLTPEGARRLLDAGFNVTVEQSPDRAIPISDYQAVGCETAEVHSWKQADRGVCVLGLKELPDSDEQLIHRHIYFAHVYKNQTGWKQTLSRFDRGGGTLYDLEYLVDEKGRRAAAFGYWAGFSGAALSMMAWGGQRAGLDPGLPPVVSRRNQKDLVSEVRTVLRRWDKVPTVLVIGALGRCGRGALQLCRLAGASVVAWDLEETQRGGPFAEILNSDILINCVFVKSRIPPFVTKELLKSPTRRLNLICDVSCDPYSDFNPLPVYDSCTSFTAPTLRLDLGDAPLHLIAIDHLPSLLPIESSHDFSRQLLPHLLRLGNSETGVWGRALDVFVRKTKSINAP